MNIRASQILVLSLSLALAGFAGPGSSRAQTPPPSDGPVNQGVRAARPDGNARLGRDVFRFETFGNEGFWTDAVRLPAGVMAANLTPMQALKLGLNIDIDVLNAATKQALAAQLKADPTGQSSTLLNDPKVTVQLFNANAVIGMPAKDSNGDGIIDVAAGDKVGASCSLCHTVTDGSVLSLPSGGAIGHRQDGLAAHNINIGAIFAAGTNSRALYPVLQLALTANGGKTLGRAPTGLTENSTEAEVDAYLNNPQFYPVGMFDDTFDGNGDPMHNTPLFRQDLAAPFGSEGTHWSVG